MSSSVIRSQTNKNVLAMIYKSVSQSSSRAQPSHSGLVYGQDVMRPRSRKSAIKLIGSLLGHGARAKRATNPYSIPKLNVMGPAGRRAIRIQFGA